MQASDAGITAAALDCAGNGVSTVEARVYDESASYLVSGGPWECDAHSGTISGVPVGSNRVVVILGKDDSGEVLYCGKQTAITVTEGQRTHAGTIAAVPAVLRPLEFSFGPCSSASGDVLTVNEVKGTLDIIVPGAEYEVTGSYTLGSRDSAWIAAANTSPQGIVGSDNFPQVITAGSGNYTAGFTVQNVLTGYETFIGIGFYPAGGGSQFFGSGYGCGNIHILGLSGVSPPPENVSAFAGDGEVTITWGAALDATSYNIYWAYFREVSKDDFQEQFDDITDTSFTHLGLTNGTTYYYVVTAENSHGESDESDVVPATPGQDDAYEENDTLETAWYPEYDWEGVALSGIYGLGIAHDFDWYEIDVPAGCQEVEVYCQFAHADGDIDIELYDAFDENPLDISDSNDDNEFIGYTVESSGTYYIEVYYFDTPGNTYDLWWECLSY
jgi:hypothetical protein